MTTQTAGAVGAQGETAARPGHHEHIDTRDNVGDPDVLGWYGLEPDSRTCVRCGDTPRQVDEAGWCSDCIEEGGRVMWP